MEPENPSEEGPQDLNLQYTENRETPGNGRYGVKHIDVTTLHQPVPNSLFPDPSNSRREQTTLRVPGHDPHNKSNNKTGHEMTHLILGH